MDMINKNDNFKMKITTMRRPDGKNQYKITLPKVVVEMCQRQKLVAVGEIFISSNDAVIEITELHQEDE